MIIFCKSTRCPHEAIGGCSRCGKQFCRFHLKNDENTQRKYCETCYEKGPIEARK